MAKKKGLSALLTDAKKEEIKIAITGATIKDDLCNYSFDILSGTGTGDNHAVKGSGLIDEDLREAFNDLNVHPAAIDDSFKGMKAIGFDEMKLHERATLYMVDGFKITGSEEDEAIILLGSKHVSASGERMKLTTPRIPLNSMPSYKWAKQLKKVADAVREEVELYKGGKCTAPDPDETDPKQLNIESNESFEAAKV